MGSSISSAELQHDVTDRMLSQPRAVPSQLNQHKSKCRIPGYDMEWMAEGCSGPGAAVGGFQLNCGASPPSNTARPPPSQWLLGHILRLLDDRRWLLAHFGLDLDPPSSRFAESLAPGGRFASTAYVVASKTQAPNPPELESEYPQGRHRACPFSVREDDASLADNVLRLQALLTMLQHLREMDAINLVPSLSSSTSVPGSTGARTDPHWGTDGDDCRSSTRMTPLRNATSNQDKFDGEMIRDASENKSQRSQAQTLKILIWGVDN
ncbi:hypothetical protein NCS52_00809300 [Fusarium sp. LHS14.1]|nr:hypothetical protein NCS52_00809300 [Fusarium sp. LHS14.1]